MFCEYLQHGINVNEEINKYMSNILAFIKIMSSRKIFRIVKIYKILKLKVVYNIIYKLLFFLQLFNDE